MSCNGCFPCKKEDKKKKERKDSSPCCRCCYKKVIDEEKEQTHKEKDSACGGCCSKKEENEKETEPKQSSPGKGCCSCKKENKIEKEQKNNSPKRGCCSCKKENKKEKGQKHSSPTKGCCSCKKENKKEKEQKHSKNNGNPDMTVAVYRPRVAGNKRIRKNQRVVDSTQCNDPDCPFNRVRTRQTMPSGGRTRGQRPRRTQTQTAADGDHYRPRRERRAQQRHRSPSPIRAILPPPPRVRPPAPPRTPLPPMPQLLKNKSFIHMDKYVTTDDYYDDYYSESPPQQQFRDQTSLPVVQPNLPKPMKMPLRNADEEVIEARRRLRPIKKAISKESIHSEETNEIYKYSEGSSQDIASNTTQGYIPPAPPMPPYLLSYRNVLMPAKKTILPKKETKKSVSKKEKEAPLTIVDEDNSQITNFMNRSFRRLKKKISREDSITILDVNTNIESQMNSNKPRYIPPAHKRDKKLMLVVDDFK